MASDDALRAAWIEGDAVEVFSSSQNKWFQGRINKIFTDDEGEWLEVHYVTGSALRQKQLPRDDDEGIRPLKLKPIVPTTQSATSSSATESDSVGDLPAARSATTARSGPRIEKMPQNNAARIVFDPNMTSEELDEQLRATWDRGSSVEIWSRSRKKWMRGRVLRVFVDEEGEWLEVMYGQNLKKEIPRDSPDIRPWKMRYVPQYIVTKNHVSRIEEIFDVVDLEKARHLDYLLLASLFAALNVPLEGDDLEMVFAMIDREERGAVTVDEIVQFLRDSVESQRQREVQQKVFDAIDKTLVLNELALSQEIVDAETARGSRTQTIELRSLGVVKPEEKDEKAAQPESLMEEVEFSGDEDEGDEKEVTDVPEDVVGELTGRFTSLGLDSLLTASAEDQAADYNTKSKKKQLKIPQDNEYLAQLLVDIQAYMVEKVEKAGVDGLRMGELGGVVARKFKNFDRKNYLPTKSRFADFVALCPGLVVVEMENENRQLDRIAVTEQVAVKINLRRKLQTILAYVFDKTRVSPSLTRLSADDDPLRPRRRSSIRELLLTAEDFSARIGQLGIALGELEKDELFWAIEGSNSMAVSPISVGRFFSQLADQLPVPVSPNVVDVLPKLIDMARLSYRRSPLWSKYILKGKMSSTGSKQILSVVDRQSKMRSMMVLCSPRTRDDEAQQLSFHKTVKIINKLQRNEIARKVEHGMDRSSFCIVVKTPYLASIQEMVAYMKDRGVPYTERFISHMVSNLLNTVKFCHDHNVANLNVSLNTLAFDAQCTPIIVDLSLAQMADPQQEISTLTVLSESAPTEIALTISEKSSGSPPTFKLNGELMRKGDIWQVGIVLYMLVTGQTPFEAATLSKLLSKIMTSQFTVGSDDLVCSDGLKDLLIHLLERQCMVRQPVRDLLRFPWFKNARDDELAGSILDGLANQHRVFKARQNISAIVSELNGTAIKVKARNYFDRLDGTGRRKTCKMAEVKVFIQDILGYSAHRAAAIADDIAANVGESDLKYVAVKGVFDQLGELSPPQMVVEAIFKGCDPNGVGVIEGGMLKALFGDVSDKAEPVEELAKKERVSYDEVGQALALATDNGFDINELLPVEVTVQ